MSKSLIDREKTLLQTVSAIVQTIKEDTEDYDSIDFIIDLLASTIISTVEEYLQNEYDEAYRSGLDNWVNADPVDAIRQEVIYAEVDGKSFAERILEYASAGVEDFESKLSVLIATDGHRVRSEGILDAADTLESVGLTVTKRWEIVGDGKTRDAHYRLKGVTIPYGEKFKIDGYASPAPGLFGVAELDCNCRCWLTLGVR